MVIITTTTPIEGVLLHHLLHTVAVPVITLAADILVVIQVLDTILVVAVDIMGIKMID